MQWTGGAYPEREGITVTADAEGVTIAGWYDGGPALEVTEQADVERARQAPRRSQGRQRRGLVMTAITIRFTDYTGDFETWRKPTWSGPSPPKREAVQRAVNIAAHDRVLSPRSERYYSLRG